MITKARPHPPVNSAAAPSRIGRFHIARELGRGAVGVVYVGHDPVIDRDVAIKTFNPKLSAAEKKLHDQQFINEARAAGRLSHPHIVTIFEAASEAGETYIAMELLQGKELRHFLDTGHVFAVDEVAAIMHKLADALDYAHRHGVVHRDIKPANIFLLDDGQPKLVDFGIARAPNRVAAQLAIREAPFTLFRNNLLGTPNYMSPEQATGREVDGRTDIYSLGAVMFEMLTRRKPFLSRDTDKLLHMIAYKAPAKPHEIDAEIPRALSQIVMRAMSKQADKRFQKAGDMATEIKRYLADHHPIAAPDTILQMSRPVDEVETDHTSRRTLVISCIALLAALAAAALQFWMH